MYALHITIDTRLPMFHGEDAEPEKIIPNLLISAGQELAALGFKKGTYPLAAGEGLTLGSIEIL